ncbi:MAG: methylmalonyl-CoA mutase [Deltaproteobacteria bacterium]|nr:methylmalonyl-CoA mutase [Deltaproteobacteria bacterium]
MQETAKNSSEKAEERRKLTPREAKTTWGSDLKVSYTPKDLKGFDYERDLGEPGQYPFTRGIYPLMYRGRFWSMRLYAGFETATTTNERFRFLLDHGQTGLSVALDLPTQLGLDADDPAAEFDVGRVGVAINTLRDMEEIFEGIPLDKISTSFTVNATASIILAMYVVAGEKQGVSPEKLRGTIQNDILKEYVARGTWIFPPEPSLRLIGDTIEYCIKESPRFNPLSITGHQASAGATPIQTIAYSFLNAMEYAKEMMRRGYDIDDFAYIFAFGIHPGGCGKFDFFESIARLRAARRTWARLMKERFKAKKPDSMRLRFYSAAGGDWMQKREPLNNIARMTVGAMAIAFGGAQSMRLPGYDEAYAIPTEEAALTALRVEQILAYETGIGDVVDPLAGSYYVEALTNEAEKEIYKWMDKIESMGGILAAIERGFIQKEMAREAYINERKIRSGEIVRVGVNKFVSEKEETHEIQIHEMDPEVRDKQIHRLNEVKSQRDGERVRKSLAELRQEAEAKKNVMPYLLECIRAYATMGEMVKVFKEVYGIYREASFL